MAAVVNRAGNNTVLPLLFRLTPQAGNSSKLTTARTLIRALLKQFQDRVVTVLVDSWYMRRSFIQSIQVCGIIIIDQVRIDTVLCKRPGKYGTKYTKTEIKRQPLI